MKPGMQFAFLLLAALFVVVVADIADSLRKLLRRRPSEGNQ
jgi:hypothetical protein